MSSVQDAPLRTMVVRVSPDDVVIYANRAVAQYLGATKRDLVGSPLQNLARRARGRMSECFKRPATGRTSNQLITDPDGRVFEARLYSEGGVLDIVLDEVTRPEFAGGDLDGSSGVPLARLNEEEVRTARHPERRFVTVTWAWLHGVDNLARRLSPMDVRLMVDSFTEEAADAILETGCTVGESSGEAVMGLFGAPRYFADHPLRAIQAACEQLQKASHLHSGLYREGKELPPCSCGVWSGDAFVGSLGSSQWQRYTAIGGPVDLARKLSRLARPGEAILPEETLTQLFKSLPEGWQFIRAESEYEPDLADFQWEGDEIVPLPEHLRKVVYLVGRGVEESVDRVEFYFDYLWALRVPGDKNPTPILRVVRPALVGDSIELSDENVVTTQATQPLGKYKLVEVIGSGGMGKVWRGVDRFGNILAIKVLHSGGSVTDAQLRRFKREAEVMARLPHRNICRVFEMSEFEGIHFIAMEFVDGLALSDLLYETSPSAAQGKGVVELGALIRSLRAERSSGAQRPAQPAVEGTPPADPVTRILPFEQTLAIILKVCDAVQFAHAHGVLHRDLKPGNILLREDGEPLVADFGLAKLATGDESQSLSLTGHVVGTMENMAPEQAESSKDVDERADVYSIGTILYQMLTGHRHFIASGNIVADAQALKTHQPARPRSLNSHIHSDLEIITLKALRADTEERYRTVAALSADLEHYRRGEVISAKPVSPVDLFMKLVQRNRALSAVIVASVLIFVSVTMLSIYLLRVRLHEEERARREAQEQRALAESRLLLANEKEQEAKRAAGQARAQQLRAENALAEVQRAESAAREAQERSNQARAETKAERDRREEAERNARQREEELREEIARITAAQESPSDRPDQPDQPAPQAVHAAREALLEAMQIFNLELSSYSLRRLEKEPEQVVHLLTKALDSVCRALRELPEFVPAWMLKGRLHLALMEYERAVESFRQAARAAGAGRSVPKDDPPGEMLALAQELSRSSGRDYEKDSTTLRNSALALNQSTGNIMQFLAGKPALRKSSAGSWNPLGRPTTVNEAALALFERNGPSIQIFVKPGTDGRVEAVVWGAEQVADLSPLKELQVAQLAVIGAGVVDWQTILSLPLESLDLSNSPIDALPASPRGFLNIRSLKLASTDVSSLEFVRTMPALESLDVSATNITDLSPLLTTRRLRQLNISGLNAFNLRSLLNLPVESLTLSPMLITDKVGLNSLRQHRTIKFLRDPSDPQAFSAVEFWKRFDGGSYRRAE